jgi:hypothetical protein
MVSLFTEYGQLGATSLVSSASHSSTQLDCYMTPMPGRTIK